MSLRRGGVFVGVAVVLALTGVAHSHPLTASPQPNIVVVLTDDEPALDGRMMDYMPNSLAIWKDAGVDFTNFHIESPLCCPGRAGFLTGQHTANHGVTKNGIGQFKPAMTLATQLHAIGYYTMLAGKYLNGYEQIAPIVPPGWDRFSAITSQDTGPAIKSNYYNYNIYNDGNATPEAHGSDPSDYSTDVIASHAVDEIANAPPGQPIFAWIAPTAPHDPVTPAPRYTDLSCPAPRWGPANYNEADVSDKPNYVQGRKLLGGNKASSYPIVTYCRTMRAVDDLVGSVRDALQAAGRLDNTIFIYTSDNGFHLGEHRIVDKLYPYVTDVPFYVSWPAGLTDVPRTVTTRVENLDFAPTICALAGCTLGPYPNGQAVPDGMDASGLLLGTDTSLNRDAVLEDLQTTPNWSSVATTGTDRLVTGGPWHYIETVASSGITQELYDISNGPCYMWEPGQSGDPCELQNLLADPTWVQDPAHAAILAALQARLAALKNEKGLPQLYVTATASPSTYGAAGDVLTYTYTITNTGTTPVDGPITVTDSLAGTTSSCGDAPLLAGASTTCTATYQVGQADVDAGSVTDSVVATAPMTSPAGPLIVPREAPLAGTRSITTQLSASAVTTGTPVTDQATLVGFESTAGGTVTYNVYPTSNCSGTASFSSAVTVTNGVVPPSEPFTATAAGSYQWQAVYTAPSRTLKSVCGSEPLTVSGNELTSNTATFTATVNY